MNERVELATDETSPAPANGARILIVDDEPCISDLLSEMLRLLGHTPVKCFSPVAALRLIKEEDYDVILSDFRMPQMNGDELFAKAVGMRPEMGARFVFLTGDAVNEGTQDFLKKQARPHLSKPFDISSVERVVREVAAQGCKVVRGCR